MNKKVRVGMIGSQMAANTNASAINKVFGLDVKIKTVASLDDNINAYAEKYGIESCTNNYFDILNDEEIDVVVICTPPQTHVKMISDCLDANKHIICEKPLDGYFGLEGDAEPIGRNVKKRAMYEHVLKRMDSLNEKIEASDRLFMYAENWVHSPSVAKALEFIKKSKSKVIFLDAKETQSGSKSPASPHWSRAGGGSLSRLGAHPIAALLYIKAQEAKARGEVIKPVSLICDSSFIGGNLTDEERRYLDGRFVDVEDFGLLCVTFSDGTKASLTVGDIMLGGTKNFLTIYTNESVFECNMTPNNQINSYVIDPKYTEGIRVSEKVETTCGWQNVWINDDIARGYIGEFQEFMECVAYDRKPGSDFQLAYDTTRLLYAAYTSAEEGCRFYF